MAAPVQYSPDVAKDVKRRIRTQMGKIEDAAHSLGLLLTDGQEAIDEALEAIRFEADLMEKHVDQWTRPEAGEMSTSDGLGS
jgi:hypothetical protein